MRKTIVAMSVLFGLTIPTPAAAADPTGFYKSVVCVTGDSGRGYRIGDAIRNWNAAQSLVRLTQNAEAGCDTLEIRFLPNYSYCPNAQPCGGFGGGTGALEWSTTYQRWAYRTAFVGLIDLDPSQPPESCYGLSLTEHEIGHALGLIHGGGKRAVMSPDYNHERWCGSFGPYDISSVTALYQVRA